MRILVLGAAAGGGLPQWNCGCRNCRDARDGRIPTLTQSSLAVSPDGERWAVLNASPDIRAQLQALPDLHPRNLRGSPVEAVLLTNGDIDHIAGLLTLREKTSFTLHATAGILDVLAANRIFDALDPAHVSRSPVPLDAPFELVAGLTAELFAVPGKVPLFLEEDGQEPQTDLLGEQTVGVELSAGGRRACYVPGCAAVTPELRERLGRADIVFFDGTVWDDEEMRATGTGRKTGRRMGHLPIGGQDGSIAALAGIAARKVFIHINNTNPILQPDSLQRAYVEGEGWSVAQDGQGYSL